MSLQSLYLNTCASEGEAFAYILVGLLSVDGVAARGPSRLPRFAMTFVYLYIFFSVSRPYFASHVFMRGILCCVISRNFKSLSIVVRGKKLDILREHVLCIRNRGEFHISTNR